VDSLSVWDVILAVLLLLVVFVNGISVGLLMVKWAVIRGWRSAAPEPEERTNGTNGTDGERQMADGG
jgi:hypothetical protein